jgi:hypothetical protein
MSDSRHTKGNIEVIVTMNSKQFTHACKEAKEALENVSKAADQMFRSIKVTKPTPPKTTTFADAVEAARKAPTVNEARAILGVDPIEAPTPTDELSDFIDRLSSLPAEPKHILAKESE